MLDGMHQRILPTTPGLDDLRTQRRLQVKGTQFAVPGRFELIVLKEFNAPRRAFDTDKCLGNGVEQFSKIHLAIAGALYRQRNV
jgi:hypothetical protein